MKVLLNNSKSNPLYLTLPLSKKETLSNTIEWGEKRIKINPKVIPKIRTQTKKLNIMLKNIIEKTVNPSDSSKYTSNKVGTTIPSNTLEINEKAKLAVAKNKLILEKVLVCCFHYHHSH